MLPARLVRAALAARLNGIARGGSGASLAAAEPPPADVHRALRARLAGLGREGGQPA